MCTGQGHWGLAELTPLPPLQLLAWLPSYFELALGLNVERSSFLTLIPYVAMTAMMPLVCGLPGTCMAPVQHEGSPS
jgi:hypothetical protein